MKFIRAFLFLILIAFQAHAFDVPSLTGPVVDQAGLLNAGQIQDISGRLHAIYDHGGEQIQVLIIPSLNDEAIEQVAIEAFDKWKLGDQKKDNGVLFVIAVQNRKMRIEVGRGLEGAIPDIIAKRIINQITQPLFRSQNYYLGTLITTEAIHEAAVEGDSGKIFDVNAFKDQIINDPNRLNDDERQSLQQQENQQGPKKISGLIVFLILAGIWLIIFFISPSTALWILFSFTRGGGGGGGNSGGWSGGGGGSAGGGSSGDW